VISGEILEAPDGVFDVSHCLSKCEPPIRGRNRDSWLVTREKEPIRIRRTVARKSSNTRILLTNPLTAKIG